MTAFRLFFGVVFHLSGDVKVDGRLEDRSTVYWSSEFKTPRISRHGLTAVAISVRECNSATPARSMLPDFEDEGALLPARKSPQICAKHVFRRVLASNVLTAEDVAVLVQPDGCIGLPTLAALEQGMFVIAVRENRNVMKSDLKNLPWRGDQLVVVDSYLEAAGVMLALRAGIGLDALRRPLKSADYAGCLSQAARSVIV